VAAGADVHAHRDCALRLACEQGHVDVVRLLLAAGADAHVPYGNPALSAVEHGHPEVLGALLAAGVSATSADHRLLRRACAGDRGDGLAPALADPSRQLAVIEVLLLEADSSVPADLLMQLLSLGAPVLAPPAGHPVRLVWLRLLLAVPRDAFALLDETWRPAWLRLHTRACLRLRRSLVRARYRLDRPPLGALGVATPTRAELIAHLTTAGRRFAREYWTDGIPVFFPDFQAELGPVPDAFLYVGNA
jgi:hypothetical protein